MALDRFVDQEEDEFVTREERLRPFRDRAFVGPGGDLPGYEQARAQGYSPEAANIAARHGIQGGGVEETIGSPLERFERQEAQVLQFRPSAEGDVASRQFAENRQAAEMGLANRAENQIAQMRMRAGLSGSGVTGMTREEAFRRAEGGMNRMERGVNLEVRDRQDERANLTQRDVATTAGEAQLGVARYGAAAQRDVAGMGRDVDLAKLAQEGRLADALMGGAGFKTGPGGEAVYQDPRGQAQAMPGTRGEARVTLNEDGTRTVIQPDGTGRVYPGPRAGQSENDWLRELDEEAGNIPVMQSPEEARQRLRPGDRFKTPEGQELIVPRR